MNFKISKGIFILISKNTYTKASVSLKMGSFIFWKMLVYRQPHSQSFQIKETTLSFKFLTHISNNSTHSGISEQSKAQMANQDTFLITPSSQAPAIFRTFIKLQVGWDKREFVLLEKGKLCFRTRGR